MDSQEKLKHKKLFNKYKIIYELILTDDDYKF